MRLLRRITESNFKVFRQRSKIRNVIFINHIYTLFIFWPKIICNQYFIREKVLKQYYPECIEGNIYDYVTRTRKLK